MTDEHELCFGDLQNDWFSATIYWKQFDEFRKKA